MTIIIGVVMAAAAIALLAALSHHRDDAEWKP